AGQAQRAVSPLLGWRRSSPQREIDPPALRQQGRRAGHDPVDPVKGQTRLAAEHDGIAGREAQGAGRVAALCSPDSTQAGVPEREGDDGRVKVTLVTVLM